MEAGLSVHQLRQRDETVGSDLVDLVHVLLLSGRPRHREQLELHETMMGLSRGRLAVALDLLTDAMAMVGQHGVYCRSQRQPNQPSMDVRLVLRQIEDSKGLVIEALQALAPPKKQI